VDALKRVLTGAGEHMGVAASAATS
jgi:hypothetical protein